jgi:hypothetical protein
MVGVTKARLAALAVTVTVAAALGGSARAEPPFTIGARPVWFVTAGGTAGATVATGDRGAFVGGELSVARILENRFAGLYADAYYDFGGDATYVTLGPELGLIRRSRTTPLSFGIDGGGVLRRAGGDNAYGATGRVFIGVAGSFAIFGRYAYVDDAMDRHVFQVGITLKFPLAPPFGAATSR